jgi:carboxypeptidase Q
MVTPRVKPMAILGLGGSVGTGNQVITAQVMVVKTFDELKMRGNEAKGKFIVFNFDYVNYPVSVEYRAIGASEASKYGALAALVKKFLSLMI